MFIHSLKPDPASVATRTSAADRNAPFFFTWHVQCGRVEGNTLR